MKYTGTAGILYDRLKSEILVADGAFGTYYAKKYDTGSLPELANLQASDRVLAIHKEYIEAGAKIIRTNTFASNTVCLGAGFDEVRNNIKNAVDIAREAVKGTDVLVAADIGPIPGENMIEKEHIEKEYVDIVNVFKECGVDIFVFETFPELGFIDKAIENAGENGFVITQFAINQFGYSSAGFSARKLIEEAEKNSYIDACGFNCGVGPGHMKKLVQSLINRNDKYFAVLPNAGYPQVVSGRMVFDDNNAAYFSQIMHDLAEDGADIIGGCCGTTPEYIRQMVLKTADVVHKKNASIEEEITEKKTANDVSFYKGKEGRKLIAVELAPPLGIDDEKIMDAAFLMKESGVDVLTFPDSPSGRTRADSILMAEKVSRETGMCVMPHICCRDKNAIAMRSQLLGAHINDINNFLVITGDPIPSVVRASVKSVFNFDSVGLMNIISDMNQPLGNSIGNSLEVIESIQVLKNEGPKDVKELVLKLGSYMVSLAKNISLKEAKNLLEENLKNDNAYNKFKEFVRAQGGNIENIKVAPKVFSVKSIKSGYVTEIDTQKLGEIVKLIGGGRTKKEDKINYGVGIVLSKKIGDYVNKDEEILKIYLDDKDMSIKEILDCFKITDKKVKTKLIKEIIL